MEKKDIARLLASNKLDEDKIDELASLLLLDHISLNVDKDEEMSTSVGDKMADRISNSLGSWKFIIMVILFLFLWIFLNLFFIKIDIYPFILLNLILSCVAAVQAPIIMMSQNRAAKKDSIRNQNDYITDLKSEIILEDLHNKIVLILKNQDLILTILDNIISSKEE